jgi:hypothetical protein
MQYALRKEFQISLLFSVLLYRKLIPCCRLAFDRLTDDDTLGRTLGGAGGKMVTDGYRSRRRLHQVQAPRQSLARLTR